MAMRKNIEQQITIAFVQYMRQFYPDVFKHLFHIKNESKTSHHADSGVKPGVPDFFLSMQAGEYHGLYIEFKAPSRRKHKTGGLSAVQVKTIALFKKQGYKCVVCYDYMSAVDVSLAYLNITNSSS